MTKKMLIDAAHPEEVRVAVLDNGKVEDFDFEFAARKPLRGNIYLARVTRVEPSLQAAFVEYGGNRHGFLAFSEIHPDYYQIPVSDRQALQKAEAEVAELADLLDVSQPGDEDDGDFEDGDSGRHDHDHDHDDEGGRRTKEPPQAEAAEAEAVETADEAEDAGDDENDDPVDEIAEPSEDEGEDEDEEEEDGEEDENAAPQDDDSDEDDLDAKADDEPEEAAEEADAGDDEEETVEAATESADAASADESTDDEGEESEDDDEDSEDSGRPQRVRPTGKEREALFEKYKDAKRRRSNLLRNYKIQEVIKRRQILLVQVVKEERGNKGAALTTYMSLAGRYCVLMPNTARGGGISRKIPHSTDRKRLRRVVDSLDVPQGMGLIIRTAGAKRTKVEVKRDYDYLLRLRENIRSLTLKSIAPCLIYEEASLIKRAIRDLYDKDIGEVQVEGENGYREAKDFMKMLMPSHAKFVQPYKGNAPIFLKHGVETQLDGMYQPSVRLKSGGYIVIHQTEALVAIDVNSGRATRERNIEQTALKTNIEAAYEAARQFRLRDLAGLIVLDFIDMEEPKNNRKVEKALKDAIKHDRARIQLGRISNFGLLEMSRQRRRSGIVDGTTQACPTCAGAGVIRSSEMAALRILRAAEGEAVTGRAGIISIHASLDVTVYVLNHHRDWLKRIEEQHGVTIQMIPDTGKTGDEYAMEKSGVPRERAEAPAVIQADQIDAMEADEDAAETDTADAAPAAATEDREGGERKKRRRRRRKDSPRDGAPEARAESGAEPRVADESDGDSEEAPEQPSSDRQAREGESGDEDSRRRRRRGRRGGRRNRRDREDRGDGAEASANGAEAHDAGDAPQGDGSETADAAQEPSDQSPAQEQPTEAAPAPVEAEAAPEPRTNGSGVHRDEPAEAPQPEPAAEAASPDLVSAPQPKAPDKPKKTGWWRRGSDA